MDRMRAVQTVKVFVVVSILGLAGLAGTGCARVKPYEREHLSRRSMTADEAAGQARFEHHSRGSREGAAGGTGKAGGGCGCN